MRKVVRTNRWHSVEVQVRSVAECDGGGREIRLAADQKERWNGTYLTPKSAMELACALVRAAVLADSKIPLR